MLDKTPYRQWPPRRSRPPRPPRLSRPSPPKPQDQILDGNGGGSGQNQDLEGVFLDGGLPGPSSIDASVESSAKPGARGQKEKNVRGGNWEPGETRKLIEARLEALIHGKGKLEAEVIVPGRSAQECHDQWDVVVKLHETIKSYCDAHGKGFSQITEEEFRCNNLGPSDIVSDGEWLQMIVEMQRRQVFERPHMSPTRGEMLLLPENPAVFNSGEWEDDDVLIIEGQHEGFHYGSSTSVDDPMNDFHSTMEPTISVEIEPELYVERLEGQKIREERGKGIIMDTNAASSENYISSAALDELDIPDPFFKDSFQHSYRFAHFIFEDENEFIKSLVKEMEAMTFIQGAEIEEAFQDGGTYVLGYYNVVTDNIEFYFTDGRSMAEVVGVGLQHAKVVVKEFSTFEVQQISKEEFDGMWFNVKTNSNKVFKIMKVILPKTSSDTEQGQHEDGSDFVPSSSSRNRLFEECTSDVAFNHMFPILFIWEVLKYYMMEKVIDIFHNDFFMSSSMNSKREFSITYVTWSQNLKQMFLKGLCHYHCNNGNYDQDDQGGGNGNEPSPSRSTNGLSPNGGGHQDEIGDGCGRGYGNGGENGNGGEGSGGGGGGGGGGGSGGGGGGGGGGGSSGSGHQDGERKSQITMILLSGGDFFKKDTENTILFQDKKLQDVKIAPRLTFDFIFKKQTSEVKITIGTVCFELDKQCDDILSSGLFGWFHDEAEVSLHPLDSNSLYLKEDFSPDDFVLGKAFVKVSKSTNVTTTYETGVSVKGILGNSQIGHVGIGGNYKQQNGGVDNQGSEHCLEFEHKLTTSGFLIKEHPKMDKALLQYQYLAPERDINLNLIQNASYRNQLIASPLCGVLKTKFSGTWVFLGKEEFVHTFVFEASQNLRKIQVIEANDITSSSNSRNSERASKKFISFGKKKRQYKDPSSFCNEAPQITQRYVIDLFVNFAKSYRYCGKTYIYKMRPNGQDPLFMETSPVTIL